MYKSLSIKVVFLVFAIFVAAISCKKEDVAPEETPLLLLTSNQWSFSGVSVTGSDVNIFLELGVKTLYGGSTFSFDSEGGSIRTTSSSSITGTWAFANEETAIIYTEDATGPLDWTIIELSATILKVSYIDSSSGAEITLTFNPG